MGTITCWPPQGWSGSDLSPGLIVDVDFSDDAGRFFILQLDGEDYTYPMRYDAVLHYADEEDRNFHKFHLPNGLLEDPANKEIMLDDLQRAKRRKTSNSTADIASRHQPTSDMPPSPIPTVAADNDDNIEFGDDNNYADEEEMDPEEDKGECITIF